MNKLVSVLPELYHVPFFVFLALVYDFSTAPIPQFNIHRLEDSDLCVSCYCIVCSSVGFSGCMAFIC